MDLGLTPEQEMLQAAVADFMAREADTTALLRMDEDAAAARYAWDRAAEAGWLGITIAEAYGGSFGTHLDAAVLFEGLGRGPLPGPYLSSAALGALLVQEIATEDQKRRLLPGVASGATILAPALADPNRSFGRSMVQMVARPAGNGGFLLDGLKPFVHDATAATHFLVAARTSSAGGPGEGVSVFLVEAGAPGVAARNLTGFLGGVGEVAFSNVEVPPEALLGEEGAAWPGGIRAGLRALPLLCAYQVGSMQKIFELSVVYSQTRRQFGQPIGRFQRVQDHIVFLVNHLDAARWTTYEALWKLDSGRDARASVHLAKAVTAEAHYAACNYAHEVHAGMGIVTQYGLTRHSRASRTLFQYLGDPAFHKRQLAAAIDL
jgi:alkylation response protein AidB-like acyl-CoA dehydrogenase